MQLVSAHQMINFSFLYLTKKKKKLYLKDENFFYKIMKFFYNNLGIPALIIYFYCMLIDLTSDYKNVYSHNVCLFGGFSYGLLVCDGFFIHIAMMWWFFMQILSFKIVFSMSFESGFCGYAFWNLKVYRRKKYPRTVYLQLLSVHKGQNSWDDYLCKSDVQVDIKLKLLLIKSNPVVFLLIAKC